MSYAPHPRSRIYTTCASYSSFVAGLFSNRINKGNDVEKFEHALAEMLGVPHAVCVPMDRVGIYLSIKNLIKPGQGVIMSPYSIADVVNMVICAGGRPVFCDIEQHSCNIDLLKIDELIDENTGAVLITHLHGVAAPAAEILAICQKHNLPLIEDAAQAFGARENDKMLGTIGDAGIYSFGMYKNVNCWYGGAVVSRNKELIDNIRRALAGCDYQSPKFIFKKMLKGSMTDLLTWPILFKPLTFWIFRFGFLHDIGWINRHVEIELDLRLKTVIPDNYLKRLTPWQARLALRQLPKVESFRLDRLARAKGYFSQLKGIDGLILPPEEHAASDSFLVFPVQYRDRKKLLLWLMAHNRDIAAQHLKNCADLPAFSEFYRDCPVARKTAAEVIVLPTYPRYPESEVRHNVAVIKDFFSQTI